LVFTQHTYAAVDLFKASLTDEFCRNDVTSPRSIYFNHRIIAPLLIIEVLIRKTRDGKYVYRPAI